MTIFEFLAIGISLMLGLGTTLLQTLFLILFANRRRVKLDGILIVWAFYVLLIQIQYYAATCNLNGVTDWIILTFTSTLLLAGLIFLSAGLVLPIGQGEYPFNLGRCFKHHSRCAVTCCSRSAGHFCQLLRIDSALHVESYRCMIPICANSIHPIVSILKKQIMANHIHLTVWIGILYNRHSHLWCRLRIHNRYANFCFIHLLKQTENE